MRHLVGLLLLAGVAHAAPIGFFYTSVEGHRVRAGVFATPTACAQWRASWNKYFGGDAACEPVADGTTSDSCGESIGERAVAIDAGFACNLIDPPARR